MRANLTYRQLRSLVLQANPFPRDPRQTHSDFAVAVAFLWSKQHEQPVSWGADPKSYPPGCRFRPPSSSTMSRRLGAVRLTELIARVRLALLDRAPPPMPLKVIDCKPLTVGNASGDREARPGRAAGARTRGYKIGVLSSAGFIRDWTLAGLNANDQTLAARLIPRLPQVGGHGWGYVAGDNGFDANPLYVAADEVANHVWVAPPRIENRGVRDARGRNSPQRARSLDLSDSPLWRATGDRATMGQQLRRDRRLIEPLLGHAAMMGLGHLPPWVRTPRRVALHVEAMLIFNTFRKLQLHAQRKAASIEKAA